MPAKDPYTHLLIIHSHVESGHMGFNYTKSHLRSKFWVPKESVVINNIVNKMSNLFYPVWTTLSCSR